MGSNADSVEKAILQSRRPHTVRGWGLLTLSFSTLGKFTRLFLFFLSSLIYPSRRHNLFGHRDLTSVRSQRYLARKWTGTPEGGRGWRNQCHHMGHDVVAVTEICECALPHS